MGLSIGLTASAPARCLHLPAICRRTASWIGAGLSGLTVVAGLAGAPTPAHAGPTLLLDAATGDVLYAEQPDMSWYPASLTKLMTAYVTFEAIRDGKITLQTVVPLSEKARGQPATRIGLRAGIELNVDQALRGLISRSANDFAMALAELVGGSEEGFAEKMNAAAKRLGMTRSHFTNPHGLPDPAQFSTARDLAILARAIRKDFADRDEVFTTLNFVIYRGTFHNQNDLLRTLDGADGMKTGFTCGAGYNVVASATRDGRRLIAVVLGEPTREERSVRAANLLEHGFKTAEWKHVLGMPKLARLQMDPAEQQPVHDMSRETRTRQCGNHVRRVRRVPGAPRVPVARTNADITVGSVPRVPGVRPVAGAATPAPKAPVAATAATGR